MRARHWAVTGSGELDVHPKETRHDNHDDDDSDDIEYTHGVPSLMRVFDLHSTTGVDSRSNRRRQTVIVKQQRSREWSRLPPLSDNAYRHESVLR